MTRTAWFLMLLSLARLGYSQGTDVQAAASPAPTEVFVDATAKHGGSASPDPSKLTITIDGKPAQVLSSHPAKDDKLLFALMVDISASGAAQQREIKDAAVKIFQSLTNEQSRGYLVPFNVQPYPSKRTLEPSEAQFELDHIRFTGGTSLYDSIAQTATGILSRSLNPDIPRRLIIVLSDGNDNYSRITADAMVAAVQREGVPVFFLAQNTQNPSHAVMYITEQFGRDTGGNGVEVDSVLDGVTALIAGVHGQLALTIGAPSVASGELHSLSVKTSEKGISIAAPSRVLVP